MSLINTNADNVFVGAIVYQRSSDEKFYVYKVNKKSMYVGKEEYKSIMDKWERRPKGTTWKNFMERHQGQMTKYDLWFISDEESSRKEAFEKINKTRKRQKPAMNKQAENQIRLLYEKMFLKGKTNYRYINEIRGDRVIVVLFDKNEWAFLNINGSHFLYDLRENLYFPYKKEVHKPKGKEVLWPKREYEKEEQKEAV